MAGSTDGPVRTSAADGDGSGSGPSPLGGGLGGLPPLRQPTGEQPVVPSVLDDDAFGGTSPAGIFDGTDRDEPESVVPSALTSRGRPESGDREPSRTASPILRRDQLTGGSEGAALSASDGEATAAFPSWGQTGPDRTVDDRPERSLRRPGPERRTPLDAPTSHGPNSGRPPGRPGGGQRLQESEIKLAGRQDRPDKPQEPNRLLLGLAIVFVLLAGAGVAWWLTRDGGDATDDTATTTPETSDAASTETTAPAAPAQPAQEPVLDVPQLSFIGVEPGPLDPSTTYSIDLAGEAPGSMLQVVVDGVPQGEPDALLPDLILPPGRHTLTVSVTNGAEVKTSTPLEVYVLGDPPAQGTLANLASVDILNEGWAEAIRRYDGFRDAGHQNLQILPITPGYWNIFVPGLGDDEASVVTYCEGFGLALPDDCFAKAFDPATYVAPAAPVPGTTGDTTTGDTTTDTAATGDDGGAATDQGGETTSTTTGG